MNEVVKKMLIGFPEFSEFVKKQKLTEEQLKMVDQRCESISSFKKFYQNSGGYWYTPETVDFDQYKNMPMRIRGRHLCNRPGHYLSTEEANQFENTGLLGPYPLLTSHEAEEIKNISYGLVDTDCYGDYVFSKEIIEAYKKTGNWNINSIAFPALYRKELWDLISSREIAERVACLLGDNVICWAQKHFEKKPGDSGTLWHQATTFQETSSKPKLKPTTEVDSPIIQVTVWIALTDSTIKNGCMRIMPGSFRDIRYDHFFYYFKKNMPYLLMNKPEEYIQNYIKASVGGIFPEGYAIFSELVDYFEDIFIDYEPVDLEVKAGEFIIFTSSNMHASYPNVTTDDTRLALAGRYTNSDVITFCNNENLEDYIYTPLGAKYGSLEKTGCIQVHGNNDRGLNRIVDYKW